MTSNITLPVITVQPTFPEVIGEVFEGVIPFESIWVSCYKHDEPTVHGKIQVELNNTDRNKVDLLVDNHDITIVEDVSSRSTGRVGPSFNFYATMNSHLILNHMFNHTVVSFASYLLACKSLNVPQTKVITPSQEYRDDDRSNPAKPHRITAFSVSPDSSRFATGFLDGSVLLYPSSTLTSGGSYLPHVTNFKADAWNKVTSVPHLSTVSSLQFFPSSKVLLSSGNDFTVTILPADLVDSSTSPSSGPTRVKPVRTLRAHTRPVTSTVILGVGRSIVSSSLDSTVKLWDVSSGEVSSTLNARAAIVSSCLGDYLPNSTVPDRTTSNPNGTDGNLIYSGLANGAIEVFDLRTKQSVGFHASPSSSSPLNSITFSQQHNLLASGSSKGIINLYDIRSLNEPVTAFSRLEAGVETLSFISLSDSSSDPRLGLAVGTSDGLPYIASVLPDGPEVWSELIGVDCDAVRRISVRGNEVWCASDDGIVRRYVC